jgi:hypothetical protein
MKLARYVDGNNHLGIFTMTTYTLTLTPTDAPSSKVGGLSRSEALTALTNLMYATPDFDAADATDEATAKAFVAKHSERRRREPARRLAAAAN